MNFITNLKINGDIKSWETSNKKILTNHLIGAILALVVMGHVFYYIGAKLPIFRSYLGGGSVFTIVTAAVLAASGIIPPDVVKTASGFINTSDFLDLYIVSLMGSSIFRMNRSFNLKGSSSLFTSGLFIHGSDIFWCRTCWFVDR